MIINGLDIETTGFSHKRGDKIVQFCAIEVFENNSRRIGNVILNPLRNIPQDATNVHGIKNSDVKDKAIFKDYSQIIFDILKNSINVGHNIKQFDLPFILQELFESGWDVKTFIGFKFIDTLTLARKTISSKKYDLDTLCKYFDITNKARELHDAQEDVELTLMVFNELAKLVDDINEYIEIVDEEYLNKHLINNRNQNKLPNYVSKNNDDIVFIKQLLNEKNINLKLIRKTNFVLENLTEDKSYISIWSYSKKHYIYTQLILDKLVENNVLDNNFFPTVEAITNKKVQFKTLESDTYPNLVSFVLQESLLKTIFQEPTLYKTLKTSTLEIAKSKFSPQSLPDSEVNKTKEDLFSNQKINNTELHEWLYS